jgi:hypothetical protein
MTLERIIICGQVAETGDWITVRTYYDLDQVRSDYPTDSEEWYPVARAEMNEEKTYFGNQDTWRGSAGVLEVYAVYTNEDPMSVGLRDATYTVLEPQPTVNDCYKAIFDALDKKIEHMLPSSYGDYAIIEDPQDAHIPPYAGSHEEITDADMLRNYFRWHFTQPIKDAIKHGEKKDALEIAEGLVRFSKGACYGGYVNEMNADTKQFLGAPNIPLLIDTYVRAIVALYDENLPERLAADREITKLQTQPRLKSTS